MSNEFDTLIQLIKNNSIDEIATFLDQHENVLEEIDDSKNALAHAVESKNLNIVRMILEKDSSANMLIGSKTGKKINSTFFMAVYQGSSDIVKAILEKNCSNEVILSYGTGPLNGLMFAARKNNTQIVDLILKKNSSLEVINAKNRSTRTALMYAAMDGSFDTVNLILGAVNTDKVIEVINAEDINGDTALMYAIKRRREDVAETILEKSKSIEILKKRNKAGNTALMLAIEQDQLKVVKAILKNHHSNEILNLKDRSGRTPLMLAAEKGNVEIVKAILEKNASSSVINMRNDQFTAINYAKQNDNIVEILKTALSASLAKEKAAVEREEEQARLVEKQKAADAKAARKLKKINSSRNEEAGPQIKVDAELDPKVDAELDPKVDAELDLKVVAEPHDKKEERKAEDGAEGTKIGTINNSPRQGTLNAAKDIIGIQPHKQLIIEAMMAANKSLGSAFAGQNSLGQGKSKKKQALENLMEKFKKSDIEHQAVKILRDYWKLAADPRTHTFTTFKRAEPGKTNSALAFRQYIENKASTELKDFIKK